jgi:hypothetical protein
MNSERFGFSTGALEKGDYVKALEWMKGHRVSTVELSALRYEELEPLVSGLDTLPTQGFAYISFHAPSVYPKEKEGEVVALLDRVLKRGWNIIVHPDVIYTPTLWQHFGSHLLVENMDRRKATGKTVGELRGLLEMLPRARVCLDVAHARQMDTTLTLLWSIVESFKSRIAEIHISELDSHCRHRPLSNGAVRDYKRFARVLVGIPVIIESMLNRHDSCTREREVYFAKEALASIERE